MILFPPVYVEVVNSTGSAEVTRQGGGMILFPPVVVGPIPTVAPSTVPVGDVDGGMLLFPPAFVQPPSNGSASGSSDLQTFVSASISIALPSNSSTAAPTSSFDDVSTVDSPGLYHVIHDNLSVRQGPSSSLPNVGELDSGTTITVVEVFVSPSQGPVFGRINVPVAGWLSLLNATDGYRLAEKVSSADNVTSRVAGDAGGVFGEWWHWFLVALLALLLVLPAAAAVARCVLLRRRRADKSEDEVVPFNKAVLPESDDEQPAFAVADSSPLDTKVVPVACQDAARLESPEPHAEREVDPVACNDVLSLESPDLHAGREAQPGADVAQAIVRAKVAGVSEEELWFAEVLRRRRAAAAELVRLLGGCEGEHIGPRWRPLWAMKASVMQGFLARAKTDPEAVLRELRDIVEDAQPAVG